MHQVLLVVSLGICGLVLVPYARHEARQAERDAVVRDFERIEEALGAYYRDVRTLLPLHDVHSLATPAATTHFVTGDGQQGWDGPYLDEMPAVTDAGATFDVEVKAVSQAWIVLGPRERLGDEFAALLRHVDNALDGDDDVEHGQVWGNEKGIHFGFNYQRP